MAVKRPEKPEVMVVYIVARRCDANRSGPKILAGSRYDSGTRRRAWPDKSSPSVSRAARRLQSPQLAGVEC
jgi:hypothetical protein